MYHQQAAGVGPHYEPPLEVQRALGSRARSNLHSKKLSPIQGLLCLCSAQIPHGKGDYNTETLPSISTQEINKDEGA